MTAALDTTPTTEWPEKLGGRFYVKGHPMTETAADRLGLCNSYERTGQLCYEMWSERSARERLKLYLAWGNMCDAPWPNRTNLSSALREALKEVRLVDVLEEPERNWFENLGDEISIYRGCEKGRERGMHWTVDREVARAFALGKRCINRNPVVANAVILKEHVLAVFGSQRSESEVVVDYRRLRRLTTEALPARTAA